MKTARASLTWSLLIVCPHCGHDFDLADHDEDGIYSEPIFSNKWDDLKGDPARDIIDRICGGGK